MCAREPCETTRLYNKVIPETKPEWPPAEIEDGIWQKLDFVR
jgi:hypothetical protein